MLRHLSFIELPKSLYFKAINGVALAVEELGVQVLHENTRVCLTFGNQLLGIYEMDGGLLRVRVTLGPERDETFSNNGKRI